MKNKLSWGIALLPFVPSVWMQGQEQKQGIGNRRPNMGHRTKRILRIERKEYQTY